MISKCFGMDVQQTFRCRCGETMTKQANQSLVNLVYPNCSQPGTSRLPSLPKKDILTFKFWVHISFLANSYLYSNQRRPVIIFEKHIWEISEGWLFIRTGDWRSSVQWCVNSHFGLLARLINPYTAGGEFGQYQMMQKSENDRNPGTWVLIWKYSARAI